MGAAITTTVVREPDGRLTVWVDGVQMHGARNICIVNTDAGPVLNLIVPSESFRLSERYAQPSTYETKDNVVDLAQYRAKPDNETPHTDGDIA